MVADGLHDPQKYGFPTLDIVLGQHVHAIKAGVVARSGGPILTAVDSLEVHIFGKSDHISCPDLCVDAVVMASHIVVHLQTLITKEVWPEDFAIVACASIHGGTIANIVPDFVDLKLSIQSYRSKVHDWLLAAVKRVVYAEDEASGSLQIHKPMFMTIMHASATINDVKSADILKATFKGYFGHNAIESDPFGASEDFSILATFCGAPYVFYMYGCVDVDRWDEVEKAGRVNEIPHHHSAFFAPVIQPTIRTAVDGFALAGLTFWDKPS